MIYFWQLETQGSQWCNSVWVGRAQNKGSQWYKSQFKVQGWEKTHVPAEAGRPEEEGVNSSFLHLSSYSGPQGFGPCPAILGRAFYFTEFTNSSANLV